MQIKFLQKIRILLILNLHEIIGSVGNYVPQTVSGETFHQWISWIFFFRTISHFLCHLFVCVCGTPWLCSAKWERITAAAHYANTKELILSCARRCSKWSTWRLVNAFYRIHITVANVEDLFLLLSQQQQPVVSFHYLWWWCVNVVRRSSQMCFFYNIYKLQVFYFISSKGTKFETLSDLDM